MSLGLGSLKKKRIKHSVGFLFVFLVFGQGRGLFGMVWRGLAWVDCLRLWLHGLSAIWLEGVAYVSGAGGGCTGGGR